MPHDGAALWDALTEPGHLRERTLWGPDAHVTLGDLAHASSLGGRLEALRDRSVLVATGAQLTAALSLIELDGIACRLILAPPDLPAEHMPIVITTAAVDAVVSDQASPERDAPSIRTSVTCSPTLTPAARERTPRHRTEWILLTSGTTGLPKLVVHTLATLTDAIARGTSFPAAPVTWSTFYDIRRYGGLQILLRALLGRASMVLSSDQESTGDFLVRAGKHGVTHISGTPSHWRRALMSPMARRIAPRYVRLSGEIADQAILDHLRTVYPETTVSHAFASTEAGVAFAVDDGRAGFPANLIERHGAAVTMKIEDGSLRIRSARTAARYLGNDGENLRDAEGFVDTGDMVERRGDRYYFLGRRGGIINVGGLKVHPEEVEGVLNRHPHVRVSLVRTRKNPITGALVVADVVLTTEADGTNGRRADLADELLQLCRRELPRHKVPATITFVPSLAVAPTGKIARHHA